MPVWLDSPRRYSRLHYHIRFHYTIYEDDDYSNPIPNLRGCHAKIIASNWQDLTWQALQMAHTVRSRQLFRGWEYCSDFQSTEWIGRNGQYYQITEWRDERMLFRQRTILQDDIEAFLIAQQEHIDKLKSGE